MTTFAEPGHLPVPETSESPHGPAQLGAVADRLAALFTGITTLQRDALSGTDLWVGRRIYNTTTEKVEVYDGAAWKAAGVTAHSDLTGLTTGDPHTQYARKATLTAKGDLYVATASGVITRKAVGADGRALVGDSSKADGLDWVAHLPLAGGTMTGDLVLAGDPDAALKAATKQYVDNAAPAQTMELISRTTLAAPAAFIDLTSIPATYDSLRVIIQGRGDSAIGQRETWLRINNISNGEYLSYYENLATGVPSDSDSRLIIGNVAGANAPANEAGIIDLVIPRYAATTFHKQILGQHFVRTAINNRTMWLIGGSWHPTTPAAINQLTFLLAAGNFIAGTSLALYGIKG